MPRGKKAINPCFQHQADATLAQANPVSGTQYEVLATTRNVRIIGISAEVTWTVQPSPLEIHITIDGQTITHTVDNPTSGNVYIARKAAEFAPTVQALRNLLYQEGTSHLWEGRSVRITAETTGGTVQLLEARVQYATIPDA